MVDAGTKCLSVDMGPAEVDERSDISYASGGDEHGILHLPEGETFVDIGRQLLMLPSHCDTTLSNFDRLYGIRNGEVVESWSIKGRGRSD
ncbi:type III PLP-dependent enzyme domain-containing protein [Veronia nyctiphanis]|uniref:hypothetical protein n=1 Tax=Veronia nyctiphanis TaxID=1278244 RepID=UPI001F16FE4A|nr:hypothetical protein [Veronia nyctiphanis]